MPESFPGRSPFSARLRYQKRGRVHLFAERLLRRLDRRETGPPVYFAERTQGAQHGAQALQPRLHGPAYRCAQPAEAEGGIRENHRTEKRRRRRRNRAPGHGQFQGRERYIRPQHRRRHAQKAGGAFGGRSRVLRAPVPAQRRRIRAFLRGGGGQAGGKGAACAGVTGSCCRALYIPTPCPI